MNLEFEPVRSASSAEEFLYMIMAERMTEPEVNISAKELPLWSKHVEFVRSQPYEHWLLIKFEGGRVGYISATKRNEIGIVLLKGYRGKGIGTAAIKKFMAERTPLYAKPGERTGEWLANINPANERSIKMFEGLGFKLVQQTYQRGEEPHGKEAAEAA